MAKHCRGGAAHGADEPDWDAPIIPVPTPTAMRATTGLLVLAFLAMVTLVATSPNRLLYDEPFFANYVSLLHQYGFTPRFLNSLNAAPGPLSAVVQIIFEPLTHLRPVATRFVNVFLLIVLALILVMCMKRAPDNWAFGCSVLVVPMTWVVAGMALSEMSAMVFVTLSLYLQLRGLDALGAGRGVLGWFLLSGVCLGIAVWGRQPYLLLASTPMLAALMERRLRLAAVVFLAAACALALPLFALWGGLVPPSQQSLQQGFSIVHGLTSLGYVGICFTLLVPRARWLPLRLVLGLVALTVIANASLGAFVLYPAAPLADRYLAAPLKPIYGNLCGSLFLGCGVVVLAALLRITWNSREDLKHLTLNAGLLCVAVSPVFIPHQYSSRYAAMSLPYLMLAAHRWRQWELKVALTAALGCGVGFLSLSGYFSQ